MSISYAQINKENPAIGEETISVLLFPYENRERVQQMFSDLNRFVVKTSKSLDILFDKRDPLSIVRKTSPPTLWSFVPWARWDAS